MDERLYGYGPQFNHLFWKLFKCENFNPKILFDLWAFHQTHIGSFSNLDLKEERNQEKQKEKKDAVEKLKNIFEKDDELKLFLTEYKQPPLIKRRADVHYESKEESIDTFKYKSREIFWSYFKAFKNKLNIK